MIKNKSLITAFSLNKDTEKTLQRLQSKSGKTRSEIVRNLITSRSKNLVKSESGRGLSQISPGLTPDDANKILKYYYQIISAADQKPTVVIGIAVIAKSGKVLIGLRKSQDQHVKNLSWTFPSGKFSSLDFDKEVIKTVKAEAGLVTKILRVIHARLIPDSPKKKIRIVALYYHCRIISGIPKPGGDFKQLKWVPATDVTKYFTTSVADEIMNFLGTL